MLEKPLENRTEPRFSVNRAVGGGPDRLGHRRCGQLQYVAALVADQEHAGMVFTGMVAADEGVQGSDAVNQPMLLQEVEGAVDRWRGRIVTLLGQHAEQVQHLRRSTGHEGLISNRDAPERFLCHGQDNTHTIGVGFLQFPGFLVIEVAVRVAHDGFDLCGNQLVSQVRRDGHAGSVGQDCAVEFELCTGVDLAERHDSTLVENGHPITDLLGHVQ